MSTPYSAYGTDDTSQDTGVDKSTGGGATSSTTSQPYNVYRFNSDRIDDTTGNYNMGFRNYDPTLNRFLTRDMYDGAFADAGMTTDPYTGNRYTFGDGNPLSNVELNGHLFENGGGNQGPTSPFSIINAGDLVPLQNADPADGPDVRATRDQFQLGLNAINDFWNSLPGYRGGPKEDANVGLAGVQFEGGQGGVMAVFSSNAKKWAQSSETSAAWNKLYDRLTAAGIPMVEANKTDPSKLNDGESETVFSFLAHGFQNEESGWSGAQLSKAVFGHVITKLQTFISAINVCDRGCASDTASLAPELQGQEQELVNSHGFDANGIVRNQSLNTYTVNVNQNAAQSLSVAQEYVSGEEGAYEASSGMGPLYGGSLGNGTDANYPEP